LIVLQVGIVATSDEVVRERERHVSRADYLIIRVSLAVLDIRQDHREGREVDSGNISVVSLLHNLLQKHMKLISR
jgi:hypothetical protein